VTLSSSPFTASPTLSSSPFTASGPQAPPVKHDAHSNPSAGSGSASASLGVPTHSQSIHSTHDGVQAPGPTPGKP
jgi:hypothetical protein